MTDQTFEHQLIILKKAEVQSTHTEKDYGTMSPPYLHWSWAKSQIETATSWKSIQANETSSRLKYKTRRFFLIRIHRAGNSSNERVLL